MRTDEEGFFYPQVDSSVCNDCGLCEKVCPVLNFKREHTPLRIFAACNSSDFVRSESSSGGIFTFLAEKTIREKGVVFGARWDEMWNVVHSYAETLDKLKAFQSSKYVQSNINYCYNQVECFLKDGRQVLFSGTPCQIAGLKFFLRKKYENLTTVECVCHGVPSPKLWQMYLDEVSKGRCITQINHRDKCTGWRNYSVLIKFSNGDEILQPHDDNLWIRALIKNLTLRPSCHSCAYKCETSLSDITLGDLWGEQVLLPDHNEDDGISLVVVHTPKADHLLNGIIPFKSFKIAEVSHYNKSLVLPAKMNPNRDLLFKMLNKGKPFMDVVKILSRDSIISRMKLFVRRFI